MNGHTNGAQRELATYERIALMRRDGWEQTFTTGRKIRLRTLEPDMLLREGDCPDILTPLLLKSLYSNHRDDEVREFLEQPLPTAQDALAFVELLNLIALRTIVDDTKVEELTLAEKKLIFRFALGSSELLVDFEYTPPQLVDAVPQSDDVSQAPQRSFWGRGRLSRVDGG